MLHTWLMATYFRQYNLQKTLHNCFDRLLLATSLLNFICKIGGMPFKLYNIKKIYKYCYQEKTATSCRRSPTLTSLTVGTRVALGAGTLVLVRSCVDTRPSVQAWLVSATVVQIWEKERFTQL